MRAAIIVLVGAAILPSWAWTQAPLDELCLTGNARRGQNIAVPFTVDPPEAAVLFDGSHADARSVGTPAMTVTLRFTEPVVIRRCDTVVYNDPQRGFNAAQDLTVAVGPADGAAADLATLPLEADALLLCGTDDAITWGSRSTAAIAGAPASDTVRLTIRKQPAAQQCLWRELSLWGLPARLAARPMAAPLAITARDNTYSSLRVEWQTPPPGTAYVRVATRAQGTADWRSDCFSSSPGLVLGLHPAQSYDVYAEAVGAAPTAGQQQAPLLVRLPAPIEVRALADAFGMNYYPGGGGAHQPRDDETGNDRRMISLMQAAGVRHTRWWPGSPGGAEQFVEAGIAMFPLCTYERPEGYRALREDTGVWLTGTANEPDFQNVYPEDFTRPCIPRLAAAMRDDPAWVVAGPAVGGELDGPGLEYLARCYDAGLADGINVLDIHPYAKWATPTPHGGKPGCPEGLVGSVAQCRAMLASRGLGDTPIIASETGHPTMTASWFMPTVTEEEQARLIVRTHLLLFASGVQRIYWYAFQDEGTKPDEAEHHFGIVDYQGRPKAAYDTYRAMVALLGPAVLEGFQEHLSAPAYAVRCKLPEAYITPIWESGGASEVVLDAASGIVGMLDIYGQPLALPVAAEGRISLSIDETVRYVLSRQPLRVVSQRRLDPPITPRIDFSVTPPLVPLGADGVYRWQVTLLNPAAVPLAVTLDTANPFGGPRPTREVVVPAHGRVFVPMEIAGPEKSERKIVSWDMSASWISPSPAIPAGAERRAMYFLVP